MLSTPVDRSTSITPGKHIGCFLKTLLIETKNVQVLVSRSSSVGFFSLLHSTLATIIITMTAMTNVRPDTSQLITIGLSNGSGSEGEMSYQLVIHRMAFHRWKMHLLSVYNIVLPLMAIGRGWLSLETKVRPPSWTRYRQ